METMKRHWRNILTIFLISIVLLGCAHTIEIVDQTVKAGKMKSGTIYTAPMDGWFISEEGVERVFQAIEYYKYKWQECEGRK